ncbi:MULTISPECIES: hypothetical protein [Enterobacter]|uniref:hypothetical protein n=1 Tax=Enterobacter TaxID=547 RepID=UPI0013D79848|nr:MULTISPECIES: hypothetical protein [Enterobacter]NEV85078.1 hypothetical protein [Enterobacter asburiae]NMD68620.1 hypothetical protein [Enterobacter sp. DNRA5]GFM11816.1 hypothetical protein NCT2013_42340 [Enterobacter sp. M4-VN]
MKRLIAVIGLAFLSFNVSSIENNQFLFNQWYLRNNQYLILIDRPNTNVRLYIISNPETKQSQIEEIFLADGDCKDPAGDKIIQINQYYIKAAYECQTYGDYKLMKFIVNDFEFVNNLYTDLKNGIDIHFHDGITIFSANIKKPK